MSYFEIQSFYTHMLFDKAIDYVIDMIDDDTFNRVINDKDFKQWFESAWDDYLVVEDDIVGGEGCYYHEREQHRSDAPTVELLGQAFFSQGVWDDIYGFVGDGVVDTEALCNGDYYSMLYFDGLLRETFLNQIKDEIYLESHRQFNRLRTEHERLAKKLQEQSKE